VVDRARLAHKVAAVRDAVARVRAVLPVDPGGFRADRTVREVVVLNLFVALQECIALATHWVADEGWPVPSSYRETFLSLADHGILERPLAERLASAAGLRNLVAHRYGEIDYDRIHEIATTGLDDLEQLCARLALAAGEG